MADEFRRYAFGLLMVLLGFLGLLLFGYAKDAGIALFGAGLMIFAALFCRSLIVRHYAAENRQ